MNKTDLLLIVVVLLIVIFLIFIPKKTGNLALVRYKNEVILTIDLRKNGFYEVEGTLGNVKIIVENGRIKVSDENSVRHLCSKQGFISKTYESIICLPNEIVITIEGEEEFDAVVG